MLSVVKASGSTVANAALTLVVQNNLGLLTDVYAAAFQILDTTTPTKVETPIQLFPLTGRHSVDLVADRVGPGRYVAVWDSSATPTLGRYVVRWFFQTTSTSSELTFDQEFELLTIPYATRNYCTVYDLVAANMTLARTNDGSAQRIISQASRLIESYTGRQFSPTYKAITASGSNGRALLLNEPIVAVESIGLDYSGIFSNTNPETANYRVYNRHLSQNLFSPDDRDSPKIEFLHGWDGWGASGSRVPGVSDFNFRFDAGVQNVQVLGIFGYTEPDGSMTGGTPLLLRMACQLLCFQLQYPVGSQARLDVFNRQRLTSEYTRDQGYIMSKPGDGRASPYVTASMDPEIDSLLFGFMRPPQFGSA